MQKYFLFFISFFFLVLSVSFPLWSKETAFADDDEREEREDRDEDDDDNNRSESEKTTTSASTKAQTTTTTTIVENVTTVVRKDSDGDGIFDDIDPHPSILEYLIVQDTNQNGIVDTFEASFR